MTTKNLKLVLVGLDSSGKTSLCIHHAHQTFTEDVTRLYDDVKVDSTYDGENVTLEMVDTICPFDDGDPGDHQFRVLKYVGANVFMIVFAMDNIESLEKIQMKWYPEIRKQCGTAPIIMVANKNDLAKKNDEQLSPNIGPRGSLIEKHEIYQMAHWIKASEVVFTSARTGEGVENAFDTCIKSVLAPEKMKKKKWDKIAKNAKKKNCCNIM